MKEEKIKIFIIDNNKLFGLFNSILAGGDYFLFDINSVPEARRRMADLNGNIVIFNLDISSEQGLVLLNEIKNSDKHTSLIVFEYKPDLTHMQELIHMGIIDYLSQPLQKERVELAIDKAINVSRLHAASKRLIQQVEAHNLVLEKKVQERTKQLNLIYDIGQEVIGTLNLNEVLETIVKNILLAMEVEICSILLYDSQQDELKIAAAVGLPCEIISETRLKPGQSISGWVFMRQDAILVTDIETDERVLGKNAERYYTSSLISAALVAKGKAIGVINVNNKYSRQPFNDDDLWLMRSVAAQTAIAVENAKLFSDLEDTYFRTVLALTSAIDARDHYTGAHSEHVAEYAECIARELQLPPEEIIMIKRACQLHDIGKIGISDQILTKPGKLTAGEWEQIKQHTLRGVDILKPLVFLRGVIELVKQHHERFDGQGYPFGLKADEILIGARIIAVADSFDAMVTERPYRKALTKEEAVEELLKHKGTQFDLEVVDVFLKIVSQK